MDIIKQDEQHISSNSDVDGYLDALDKIYKLTLHTNQLSKTAFMHLSKANYLSSSGGGIRAFGEDHYDHRDRDCTLAITEKFELQDKLFIDEDKVLSRIKKQLLEDELNTKSKSNETLGTGESTNQSKCRESTADFKLFKDDDQQHVKSRKVHQASQSHNTEGRLDSSKQTDKEEAKTDKIDELVEKKFKEFKKANSKKDPIKMFRGGMVPRDLRLCQLNSKELIDAVVQLHTAKEELEKYAKSFNMTDT